jgi:protocatechuate 3,4-dioxygenase, alpha subunit
MTEIRPASELAPTPGQTIGPFFGYALPYDGGPDLVPPGSGRAIRLHGTVYDGAGDPVPDALLELWQADESGQIVQREGSLHRDGWTFTGWGRAAVDGNGHYTFSTLRPAPTGPGKAAFFVITIFARGLTNRLFTRAYLPDDPIALEADVLLASLDRDERASLVATPEPAGYRFDIRLQGKGETVFLRYPGH